MPQQNRPRVLPFTPSPPRGRRRPESGAPTTDGHGGILYGLFPLSYLCIFLFGQAEGVLPRAFVRRKLYVGAKDR